MGPQYLEQKLEIADKYIKPSKLYDYSDSHLPSVMNEVKSEIVKLLEKVN